MIETLEWFTVWIWPIVIGFCLILCPLILDRRDSRRDQKPETKDTRQPTNQHEFLGAETCEPQKQHPTEGEHRTAEQSFWRKQNKLGIGALITSALAVTLAGKAYFVSLGQLDEMQAEQRPWVYADAAPNNKIFVNDTGGYSFPITFTLHNTGHLPAMFAWPYSKAFLANMPNGRPVGERVREVCEERKTFPVSKLAGVTVFPGQDLRLNSTPDRSITLDNWKAALQQMNDLGVMPIIVGCVDYQIPGSLGVHHVSGFAFLIVVKADSLDGYGPLPSDPTVISADKLKIIDWFYGDAFPAD